MRRRNHHASNLRKTRSDMLGTSDEEHYWHCHEAAKHIEDIERQLMVCQANRKAIADELTKALADEPSAGLCQWTSETPIGMHARHCTLASGHEGRHVWGTPVMSDVLDLLELIADRNIPSAANAKLAREVLSKLRVRAAETPDGERK